MLTCLYFTGLGCFLNKVQVVQGFFCVPFNSPSVKGINVIRRVRGLIEVFNKLRRKISTEVGKTADELMSAIRIQTTPEVDFPN